MARPIVGVAALAAMFAVLLAASSCAEGRDFHVGGRGGWAPDPAEPFNAWAERNRFQVNDTLVFRYNKDVDAVLVVSQSHYDACNTTEPILRLGGGDSRFVFNSSGPYFFISADTGRCKAGERLIVVVLAVRNNGGNAPSSPSLTPPPPKSSSSPTSPSPVATPAPRASPRPPSPPKSSSSPTTSPPSVATTPAPRASPPPPPSSGKNASSPSLAPVPAPAPASTNGTSSPPSPSSAVALRGGVLACLIIGGAAILV
ncbi:hypothetical protein SEVIR_5G141000v4 [Setaria viridis]|uniref:Phytocyanin domain-containing protein n=2 Tax=Setaria TaxID=4554 RepID=A0A368R4M3_SETIT|nr:early nodulin-like protein 2 [Setaria italica]XP_034597830.1 early nodulin-like protein 2 [Setaria viridis]RCV25141.1 hypothetical protein SETIT_5G142900v2 [Setaria italica]TKW14033.1 hypothetical protein SEVIR_5G141000v2 [Setaria viridis]